MKKVVFTLVFALISIVNMNAYGVTEININPKFENKGLFNKDTVLIKKLNPIERYLDLKDDQKPFFNDIHNDMYNSIHKFISKRENGIDEFKMHLNNNIKNSRMVLDESQMKKYLKVINVTLANNDLSKYIVN